MMRMRGGGDREREDVDECAGMLIYFAPAEGQGAR